MNTEHNTKDANEKEHQNPQQTTQELQEDEKEEKARCEWDFKLRILVSSHSNNSSEAISDVVGVIEFEHSEAFFATGGIARKIRIYNLNTLLSHGEVSDRRLEHDDFVSVLENNSACDYYMCTPAKLSSLRWKPGSNGRVIGSGDYDGVVMEHDLERKVPIFERDEHGGRRVWSVDYSHWDPLIGASGSDDGTMQIWDPRCEGGKCVATVRPGDGSRAVCCVEFNPFGGPMVAIGCADRRAYGYDIRMLADPVIVLDGHKRTITYVKFVDSATLVSSAIDGSLKMWNLEHSRTIRTYKGHLNHKNFVGLSVWRNGGLLGCGSENNKVFVYDKRWGEPIWVNGLEQASGSGLEQGFVSSVCWRQMGEDECTLVAGGSNGALQVFEGKRKAFTMMH